MALLLVVAVGVGVRLSLKTEWVREKVKILAISALEEQFGARLQINELQGDLWRNIQLLGMEATIGDQSAYIDTLEVHYQLTELIFGVKEVRSVRVNGAKIYWNQQTAASLFAVDSTAIDDASNPLAFSIGVILVEQFDAEVFAPGALPDSNLVVQDLGLDASFKFLDYPELWLKKLNFNLVSGSLPKPVRFAVDGALVDEEISLNNLMVETGRSIIKAQLEARTTGENIDASASTKPLALQDLAHFIDVPLADENLEIELKIGGSLELLSATVFVNHPSLQQAELATTLSLNPELSLSAFSFQSAFVDVATFLPDLPYSSARNIAIKTDGKAVLANPEDADITWILSAEDILYDTLQINQLTSQGSLKNNSSQGELTVMGTANERLIISGGVKQVFAANPVWKVDVAVQNINLKEWMGDAEETKISLFAHIEGTGFELPDYGWKYTLSNIDPETRQSIPLQYGEFTLNELSTNGQFGLAHTSINGKVKLGEGELNLNANLHKLLSEDIAHDYTLAVQKLNINEITQTEDFATNINGKITWAGKGLELATMVAEGFIDLDESAINGALLNNFSGEFSLGDGILNVTNGELKSEIADGTMQGRKNLLDYNDNENRLSVDLHLKNSQPLAPLLNMELLKGQGAFTAEILQDSAGILTSNVELNLTDIQMDSLLLAPAISGDARAIFTKNREFSVRFNVSEPIISGLQIQDVSLRADGQLSEAELAANFYVDVIGSERGRMEQSGKVHSYLQQNIVDIEFDTFDFITDVSNLELQKTWRVRIAEELFGTDTLTLAANTGAFMQMIIPYAGPTEQEIFAAGSNFDIGLIQDILFGQRFVDGVISGQVDFKQNPQAVIGKGKLGLVNVNYRGVQTDSINFAYNIARERLTLNGAMFWAGEEQLVGQANVPFVLNDELLNEEFFSRNVSGELKLKPTSLKRFEGVLSDAGIENTSGIVSLSGSMSGVAGDPIFTGEIEMEEPILSGIPVDELLARFNFNNAEKKLKLESEIYALGATAAELDISYPIDYDFRTFELNNMAEDELIQISAKTSDLNLALFNDFLDPVYLSRLSGKLDANLQLAGTLSQISPSGFIDLKNARVNMPFQGITVKNITAKMNVDNNRLRIENIAAESGPGRFSAKGEVGLDGLNPTTINLSTQARRFQLSNTGDLNLIVNMDANMKGEAMRPKMTGNVDVQSGFYYVVDFGNEYLEEVTLEDEEQTSFSPFDSLAMDMTLTVGDNFFVRSRNFVDAELEVTGELDMVKETRGDVQLFGTLEANEGYMTPLGKRFELENSSIVFSGPYDNPDLDIKSSYVPQTRQKGESVVLYYVIKGDAKDQEYVFESDPYMEQSDIICYTLFNKPCYSLDSWQSVIAGDGGPNAMDVLTDVLLDQVESLATRELGVDVVQIDNSGQNGATSIKTGWYLNERTFFAIVNEITNSTPKTLFILEYILNENWDLIVTQGDADRQGVDIRYQFDY